MAFCLVNYMNDELLHTDPKMTELHEIYNDYVQYSNTDHHKRMYFDAKNKVNETKREAKNSSLNLKKTRIQHSECKAKIADLNPKNNPIK